jgi:hypothetical protein
VLITSHHMLSIMESYQDCFKLELTRVIGKVYCVDDIYVPSEYLKRKCSSPIAHISMGDVTLY